MTYTTLAFIHGLVFLFTGLWPALHYPSFEAVTGPKVDTWLVKTVGWLIALAGFVLLVAAYRGSVDLGTALVAIGFASILSFADIYYVMTKRISKVYLLDAVIEIPFVILWLFFLARPELLALPS